MPGPLVHALKASAVPLRARRATTPRTVLARTLAHNVKGKRASPSQPPTQPPEPQEHRRSWFYSANKFNQLVVIPSALLYCVFLADFGDGEHVFSPARRWLDRQKATFFSLSPEEHALASGAARSDKPADSHPRAA